MEDDYVEALTVVFAGDLPPAGKHDHFDLQTSQGCLRLHDPRRFGAVVYAEGEADPIAQKLLGRLGVEPLGDDFPAAPFHLALKARNSPIKQVLLEGSVVVGAGNIYACEALFRAGVHPRLRAEKLSRPRAERLLAALRATLARALEVGGSTLRDFRDAHGMSGEFQAEALVYGRAGLACVQCAGSVRRVLQKGSINYDTLIADMRRMTSARAIAAGRPASPCAGSYHDQFCAQACAVT